MPICISLKNLEDSPSPRDFIEGRMPDDEQYKEMQAANYEILKELSNKYIDGKMILRSKIKECKR